MASGTYRALGGLALLVAISAAGIAVGYGFGTTINVQSSGQTVTATQSSGGQSNGAPFRLTIIEPMATAWNATTAQPQFDLLGPHGLVPLNSVSLPVKTLIQVTIVSYDGPTNGSSDQEGVVKGTVGGTVYMINGTLASMSNAPMPFGQNVTSVPGAVLAHTFTIPQLGINIPVVGGNTMIAYIYFDHAGTYTWLCVTPCGFGENGDQGAMSTAGWMQGTISVG